MGSLDASHFFYRICNRLAERDRLYGRPLRTLRYRQDLQSNDIGGENLIRDNKQLTYIPTGVSRGRRRRARCISSGPTERRDPHRGSLRLLSPHSGSSRGLHYSLE